jgi:hypothetical protein
LSKSSPATFISLGASVNARVVALEAEKLEAVLDALLLGALSEEVLEAGPVLVLLVLVLVLVLGAVGVRSAAHISASMSSKSSSVCAGTIASHCLPFLLLFGILRGANASRKPNRAAQGGARCGGIKNCNTKVDGK